MRLLALACLLGCAASAAAAGEAIRTDPRHLGAVPSLPGSSSLQRPMWYPYIPRIVIRQPNQPWHKAGKVRKDLSDACRRGEFKERTTDRFRGIFEDGILGVAFGHGLNLVDLGNRADPRTIYFFRDANSTACTVLATPNTDPRLAAALLPKEIKP